MSLNEQMVRSGNFLFRWRSYLPLCLLPVFVLAFDGFRYLGDSEAVDHIWEAFCFAIATAGLSIRVMTVGFVPCNTSGRNTRLQRADTLNTRGMYSVVRHPLYLGNFLIWVGVAMFPHTWWLLLITILAFWIYYERIMFAEEEFLSERFGVDFEEWALNTPAFVPAFRKWRSAPLRFSWKSVLARENSTLLGIITAFFALEVSGDVVLGKVPHLDLGWILLMSGGLTLYITLRWLKKRELLSHTGR